MNLRQEILLDKLQSDLSIEKARLYAQSKYVGVKSMYHEYVITMAVIKDIENQINQLNK